MTKAAMTTENTIPESTHTQAASAAANENDASSSALSPEQQKIAALEQEVAALKDQRIRALAEVDNIRKRAQRDQDELSKYAVTGFARDMVSVLENLKRAADSIETHKSSTDLIKILGEGIDLTLNELLGIFERYGIKRIDPLNQKFDHNFHQAVAQVESAGVPAGTVVQVIQAGYIIHDRLLRPAMVAVSKQASEAPKSVDTSA